MKNRQPTCHRVAIIGVGRMGGRHARVMSQLSDRFEIVGIVDREPERAAAVAEAWGMPVLDSTADAIARADVVVLATPIKTHAELVLAALLAGRHVFVEKPVCASLVEAQAALATAARERRRLFVGHSERFNPVVRALARLLRDDEIVALELHRIGSGQTAEVEGLGVLAHLGVHDFDLAAYLTDSPAQVRDAVGRSSALGAGGGTGPEDLAHVLIATASGVLGHVYVDRTSKAKHRTVRVTTTRWIYEGDLLAHRLVRTHRVTGAATDVPLPVEEPLLAQARALADALDGTRPTQLAKGEDGVRALALAERAAACIRARVELAYPRADRVGSAEKL